MASTPQHEEIQSGLPEGGKARRVYLHLREEIAQGIHAPGDRLEGEQRLAAHHAVSRVTVRRALDALEEEGLIERRPGSGSHVKAHKAAPKVAADFSSLMPQVVEMSHATAARLITFSYGAPPAPVAEALGLTEGGIVQTAVRLRLVGDQPFSHLTTHVPEEIARNYTEAELATSPLYALLERSGVEVARADQQVTATLAAPEVADLLGVSLGAPLLSLTRVVRDASGRGVEYLSALYRPDLFRLEMSLTHVGDGPSRHWEPVISGPAREAAE